MLDAIGSLFVYKSPDPYEGYRKGLEQLPTRTLKKLAGTQTHYSKKRFVEIFLSQSSLP